MGFLFLHKVVAYSGFLCVLKNDLKFLLQN